MKAFILAAGLGTRLKPLTDIKPKALIEINGITLLELVINRLVKYSFNQIIINVHHHAEQIIKFLKQKNYFGIDIAISDERNLLLDTGGGLKKVFYFFNDNQPFLIHNVDILSDIDLSKFYQYHQKQNSIVTLAVQKRKSSRYFLFDDDNNLCGWENVKTSERKIVRQPIGKLSQFAFSGIHIANKEIFDYMPSEDVFSIIDFYLSVASDKRISFFDHTDSFLIDLGKKENLSEAEKILANTNYF